MVCDGWMDDDGSRMTDDDDDDNDNDHGWMDG